MQLNHHALIVADLDQAIQMYCRLLGMRLVFRQPGVAYKEIAMLEDVPGGSRLELLLQEDCDGSRLDHIAFQADDADDVDRTFERLQGEGFTPERPPFDFPGGSIRTSFLRAPDGTKIEVIHDRTSGLS